MRVPTINGYCDAYKLEQKWHGNNGRGAPAPIAQKSENGRM